MQFSLASAAFAPGAAGPSMIHAGRSAVRMQVAPPPEKTSGSISAMSEQMTEMRAKMEEDESTKAMMQALRGTNLNDDDSAAQGTTLRVVETRAGDDQLPLTYQPELLADYFGKRPLAVLTRIGQIMGTSAGWLSGVAIRALKGELAPGSAAEVESVAELRSIIVSLGPFFIKLGQALSIRPDILSPQAMVELQQLCDKVPSFDSALAMQTIRDELGVKDVSEVYSEITAEPVAAASLGQVYRARLKDGGDEVAVRCSGRSCSRPSPSTSTSRARSGCCCARRRSPTASTWSNCSTSLPAASTRSSITSSSARTGCASSATCGCSLGS
jgi:aarF domain-containing kinase